MKHYAIQIQFFRLSITFPSSSDSIHVCSANVLKTFKYLYQNRIILITQTLSLFLSLSFFFFLYLSLSLCFSDSPFFLPKMCSFLCLMSFNAKVFSTGTSIQQTEPQPEFLAPLDNFTVTQGRDVSFTCVVNNLGIYRVSDNKFCTIFYLTREQNQKLLTNREMKKTREKKRKNVSLSHWLRFSETVRLVDNNIILYRMRCNKHSTLPNECNKLPDLKFIAQNSIWIAWQPTEEFYSNYSLKNVMFLFIYLSNFISLVAFPSGNFCLIASFRNNFYWNYTSSFCFTWKYIILCHTKHPNHLYTTSNIRHDGKLKF